MRGAARVPGQQQRQPREVAGDKTVRPGELAGMGDDRRQGAEQAIAFAREPLRAGVARHRRGRDVAVEPEGARPAQAGELLEQFDFGRAIHRRAPGRLAMRGVVPRHGAQPKPFLWQTRRAMPRFSANISMLFAERGWLDRPAAAAAAGFEAIEIQFPYDRPAEDWRRAIEATGLAVSVVNLPVGDMLTGGPGLAAAPGREAEFRRVVEEARDVAAALRTGNVNVLAGYPERHGFDRARCLDTLADNLRVAADAMGEIGIGVVVEAVNAVDRPGFLLTTSEQALEAIDLAGHGNLALQHDLYHMDIMEGRPIPRLAEIAARIGHIQFADNPGRHEPGTGAIDFPAVFAAIDRLGYDGWTAAEYRPSRTTEKTLGWMTGGR